VSVTTKSLLVLMTSRGDHRRRERSWERADRDRDRDKGDRSRGWDRYSRGGRGGDGYRDRRRSRSKSPPPRRTADRRDYGRDEDRRDRAKDAPRRDWRGDRDGKRPEHRDERRNEPGDERRDTRKLDEVPEDRDAESRKVDRPRDVDKVKAAIEDTRMKEPSPHPGTWRFVIRSLRLTQPDIELPPTARPNLDPDAEEGETMDATNGDDEAMMAIMGLSGFGTTKVNAVSPASMFLFLTIITGKEG
jgi:U4/U6.U5 tri-snRNP-associated protein 3